MGYNHILLVDDNESIHEDIESILLNSFSKADNDLKNIEDELFGDSINNDNEEKQDQVIYDIDHAYQGEEAIAMVNEAHKADYPYSVVFMDVRMPPGLDGIQTINKIWEKYPHTEMVICTAYSDYTWNEIVKNLGNTDKLLFIKKPFDAIALKQMALTLTTKWQLQQKAISYTENLEQEVLNRTKQLNELVEKHKEMKEKAEEASAIKSVFLANMSHEIRTPMNGVIGMNNLLLDTELTDEQQELSHMVKKSAESLLLLINDILDFSRIEAGKLELEEVPFNLKDLIKETLQILIHSSDNEAVEINYSFDKDLPEILLGDPTRLKQILLNYGSNALKFTKEGSILFNFKLIESEGGNHKIRFAVKDTGVGIQKEKQADIFNYFSQADTSTTRKYGGTGLGLAICRQLADLMGGKVGLDSEPGVGSTFYLTASFQEVKNSDKDFYAKKQKSNELEDVLKPHKVLVVEDNKINQMVAKKMLEKEGFVVDIVDSGLEAVRAVKENKYSLILMDLQMPEMDGYQATKVIRNQIDNGSAHIPIIALTASAHEEDRKLCLAAGMDEYISKPVEKEVLMQVLKETVKRKKNFGLTAS